MERLDEDVVFHVMEKLLNQESLGEEDSSLISIECEYIQIFNEILLDLLKKVKRFSSKSESVD